MNNVAMSPVGELSANRFELITAGHHFLLRVLPLRDPESRQALATFIESALGMRLSSADADAVLLRCLMVLDAHIGPALSSLLQRYLSGAHAAADSLARFEQCVSDMLTYRGVGDLLMRQAIAIIDEHYADSHLMQQSAAKMLDVAPARLSVAFKRQTGVTFGEYLRVTRLNHAAVLLTTTTRRIKEVWSGVGYNHPSNVDHDFKQQFDVSPRRYRSLSVNTRTDSIRRVEQRDDIVTRLDSSSATSATILVVDDDDCTRTTIGRYLELEGYCVAFASSAAECLQQVDRRAPGVILLDYHLPDMSGLACLREMRRRRNRSAVALFTADWDVFEQCREIQVLGAVVLSKLCTLESLGRSLEYLSG